MALLTEQLLSFPWYREHLTHIHPRIELPGEEIQLPAEGSGCVSTLFVAVIDHNWHRFPVYLTDPDDGIRACYRLFHEVPVYRVVGYRES